tara:strand:+ start:292 stop:507 length:216 start_codon:yes stop_codon:yes gene_type:complete
MDTSRSEHPKIGDVVGCTDGDIGIVLSTDFDEELNELRVEVAWNSGQVLADPWDSQDFSTADDMFHIMSRA